MDPKTIEATWLRFQAPDGTPIVISSLQEPHTLYLGAEGYAPSAEEIARFQDLIAQVNPQVFVMLATAETALRSGVPVMNHKGRTLGFLTKTATAFVSPFVVSTPVAAPVPVPEPAHDPLRDESLGLLIPKDDPLQDVPTVETEVEPTPTLEALPPPLPPPPPHKVTVATGKKKPAPTPKKTSKRK